MKIFSFEFTSKPINWYRNEFKDMVFLGTQSRRFPQNRNFIRFSDELLTPETEISNGTYYKPILDLSSNVYVKFNPKTADVILEKTEKEMDKEISIAIITIDKSHFRLIDWLLTDESHEIIKTVDTDENSIAVVKYTDVSINSNMVLVLYNRLFKKYEYYTIRYKKDSLGNRSLICKDKTKAVGKEVMKEWEEHDKEKLKTAISQFYTSFRFSLNKIPTKYVVCTPDDRDHLLNTLPKYIEVVLLDEISDDTFDKGVKALTFYNIDAVPDSLFDVLDKLKIRYYFILDETGKITT